MEIFGHTLELNDRKVHEIIDRVHGQSFVVVDGEEQEEGVVAVAAAVVDFVGSLGLEGLVLHLFHLYVDWMTVGDYLNYYYQIPSDV